MKTITKLVGVLAAIAVGSSAFAQTSPANPANEAGSAGLLGHRYAEFDLGYLDTHKSKNDVWVTGLAYNQPLAPNIDVGLNYAYGWVNNHGTWHTNSIGADAVYYYDTGAFKPFGGVSLGYSWVNHGDNTTDWGVTAGVEYIVNPQVVLTATVDYDSDFKRGNNDDAFSTTVRGNYWFTKQVGAFAGLSYIEGGNWGYSTGVTFKF